MIDMCPDACGRGVIDIPSCDEGSCEALVEEAKEQLRNEFQASQDEQDAVFDGKLANIEYPTLKTKPSINGVTLVGDKTTADLGITVITPEQAAAAEHAQQILDDSETLFNELMGRTTSIFTQTFITTEPTTSVTFNPPGYTYDSHDMYSVYVNGLRLNQTEYSRTDNVITFATPITQSGNNIEVVVVTFMETDTIPALEDEVTDARTGEDGTTYQSLGAAIRGQVGDLKEAIEESLIGVVRVDDNGLFYVTMED